MLQIDNALQLLELKTQKRLNVRLRKRLEIERQRTKINKPETTRKNPKQMLSIFTKNMQQNEKVKESLLFQLALKNELKEK